jgi:hypothetical protein
MMAGAGGATRATGWRATAKGGNKAIANPTALPSLCTKSLIPTNVYASANGIVQRLYHYAIKQTVELRFLTVFQHVVDPARVCTVADKNSTVT